LRLNGRQKFLAVSSYAKLRSGITALRPTSRANTIYTYYLLARSGNQSTPLRRRVICQSNLFLKRVG
jgi:hypothetical protein